MNGQLHVYMYSYIYNPGFWPISDFSAIWNVCFVDDSLAVSSATD
jgi:hypothetical protein